MPNPFARASVVLAKLRDDQIASFAALAFQEAGFNLDASKRDFIQTRLDRRLTTTGCGEFDEYIALLHRDRTERQCFVEALTVHTTSFFREDAQYRWLFENGLPEAIRQKTKIQFWSAACSSGEEGWSALMTAESFRRSSGCAFSHALVGTDISTAILAQAARAIYDEEAVLKVPEAKRRLFFMRSKKDDGRRRIIPELRSCATWQQGNLVTGAGLSGIHADFAFLRNVLIYFNRKTQETVIDRVVRHIRPGGYLLTGHSETGFSHPDLDVVGPSIFRRKSSV